MADDYRFSAVLGEVLGGFSVALGSSYGIHADVNAPYMTKLTTEEQRERWLEPLLDNKIVSCFSMTEPAPGAGSDPSMLRTEARRTDAGWVINGRKHFITHGAEADYVILFAVTDPGKGARGGISCFLVDTDSPGFEVGRRQRTMYDEHQAELVFTDCRVGEDALLVHDATRTVDLLARHEAPRVVIRSGAVQR